MPIYTHCSRFYNNLLAVCKYVHILADLLNGTDFFMKKENHLSVLSRV